MFLVHLMQYKWDGDAPFPAYKTLAKRMVVSVKTARRLAKSLDEKKYLRREMRTGETNRFHLTKLMKALAALKETDEEQENAKAKKRARKIKPSI